MPQLCFAFRRLSDPLYRKHSNGWITTLQQKFDPADSQRLHRLIFIENRHLLSNDGNGRGGGDKFYMHRRNEGKPNHLC